MMSFVKSIIKVTLFGRVSSDALSVGAPYTPTKTTSLDSTIWLSLTAGPWTYETGSLFATFTVGEGQSQSTWPSRAVLPLFFKMQGRRSAFQKIQFCTYICWNNGIVILVWIPLFVAKISVWTDCEKAAVASCSDVHLCTCSQWNQTNNIMS